MSLMKKFFKKPKTQKGARKSLIKQVKRHWGVRLSSHRTFGKKKYRLIGAGLRKDIGKSKSGGSYRTIKRRAKDGKVIYATYVHGKEF